MYVYSASSCDHLCLGLAIGLVLGLVFIAVVVVVVIVILMKRQNRRETTSRRRPGPHVSSIAVTSEQNDTTYEYVNPIGLNSDDDSKPADSFRLSNTNGPVDIESQYITVNCSPK